MKIAGLTIAKNCVKYKYPIAEIIEQHKNFFNIHYIGVPQKHQDTDGTVNLIEKTAAKLNIDISERVCEGFWIGTTKNNYCSTIVLFRLNWPNENIAWTSESLDRDLQKIMLDNINFDNINWVCKIDADEMYNEEGIEILKLQMEMLIDSDVTAIAHNYLQFMGSLKYTVHDPTDVVCHIFKPGKAKFVGNDAMQFRPTEGKMIILDDIYLFHIGYIKDPKLITTRIKEHLVLNESMYPSAVHNHEKWKDYKFEFPKHKTGAKLWPIGISDAPNETEYTVYPKNQLPSVLQKNFDKFNFFEPKIP